MHTKMRVSPTLPASDIERARRFYEETLGFEVEGEQGPDGGFMFRAGQDSYFYVYPTNAPRGGNTAASFMAEDFDAEVEEFRRRGIKFEEYPDMPGVTWNNGVADMQGDRGFWFTDSEGNILSVFDWQVYEKRMGMPKAA
jgi:catechol 2,3-dioxygenase-like lactoylglutathione lyase family enzyme